MNECLHCDCSYYEGESDAWCPEVFCSVGCEDECLDSF